MYIPSSFSEENSKHTNCIELLKQYYIDTAIIKELPGKNKKGYDLEMMFDDQPGVIINVEIKSNAGESKGRAYSTWLIETFCDNEKKKLPEWRTSDVDILIIFNRFKNQAYVYDIAALRAYVKSHENESVASGVGTGQWNQTKKTCSWGLKLNWECEAAGFIKCISF